jgi:hypothetical protein
MKKRRWGVVAVFVAGTVVSGAASMAAVVIRQRECSYPPAFVRPVYVAIVSTLVIGSWFVSTKRSRWKTALAFGVLLILPVFAAVLSMFCPYSYL